MTLVDTCVWSEALRKQNSPQKEIINKLAKVVSENQAAIIGPIRQELLSGIKEPKGFRALKEKLSYFPDIILDEKDYEKAAEFFNLCRAKGVQGSNADFLICSVSKRLGIPIFTLDDDFNFFKDILKIKIFS
jgi:predicted nucleic acid-binding protein